MPQKEIHDKLDNMNSKFGIIMGAVGLVIFVSLGVFVVILYTVPKFTPFGMSGVWTQNKYMTYSGDEMEYIFRQRNMIIESSRADIIIRVRKIGFEDRARVQVFEDANGVSFNSLRRTQVDFLEELDENGVRFTKIHVREPSGMMSRTTRVYINLQRDYGIPDYEQPPYNFVLNTRQSRVLFEHDPDAQFMRIEKLVVHGTGNVTLPAPVAPTPTNPEPFVLEVGDLEVNSQSSHVDCRSLITGHTKIKGASRNIILGDLQTMDVDGTTHRVTLNNAQGNINFQVLTGSLTIQNAHNGNLTVAAGTINLTVRDTLRLKLDAREGTVRVDRVRTTSDVTMERGSLTLGSRADGLGAVGDVKVKKDRGGVIVNFANSANGKLEIEAIDGEISVHGARNIVDIYVPSMGNANVTVAFAAMLWSSADTSRIVIEGAREWRSWGQVNIKLLNDISASFHFRGAGSIVDKVTPNRTTEPGNCINDAQHKTPTNPNGTLEDWQHSNANCRIENIPLGSGGGSLLHVKTQGTITIEK